ncbi:ScyD/ScyE family protein [Actinoplanes awajinensis]|uniref:ScyD/ScyE family protein n=1 Tax=Actinoplanes awajinensis subsp. mycoplanecinus TaxID=135947 RepID=A0A101JIC1_9ACTN|nr:ScyD/ScyE family protein [Actinoplanes awajinensis]KUL27398.1 hypothetical protein ADL15_35540 [Actinoplanes awajinensis subsp. mycoplanecinus]
MITKRSAIGVVVAVAGLLAGPSPATAAPAPPPWTVASGLDHPRGLAFGPDGTLYVAEAGHGGVPCRRIPAGGQVVAGLDRTGIGPVCAGASGAIAAIRHGHVRRIVTGLPSPTTPADAEAAGAEVTGAETTAAWVAGARAAGPSDVTVDPGGALSYTVGRGGGADLRTTAGLSGAAMVYRGRSVVADIDAYLKGANPVSVLAVDRGKLVVDGGGDALLRVGPRGRISTVATFPRRIVPAPAGLRGGVRAGAPIPMDAVPTSVVRGPDGAFYVGELTGFPFPPGQARIWRIVPGERPRVFATGLTAVVDLAWGPDRTLYALQISRRGLLSGDRTGALVRVDPGGRHRVVVGDGLTAPGGLVIRGRYAYLTDCSTCENTGSVVRVRL